MEEEKKYQKGIALVVGIDNYEKTTKLDNAVFDANSMAESLERLCFYTLRYNDVDIDEFDDSLSIFVEQLKDFDVGVFYYAGHGIELDGENYLLSRNTPCDKEEGVKRYSMKLQDVVDKMNKTSCKTKILIIDACRNNPFAVGRGFGTTNLAPIFAPQGTIIAYSTSPGQKSLDGGIGKNSIYTGALLKHIDELGLPIETFFKKVRTSVYNLSEGKQTSWEHTSLIGNFSFNSGQMVHSLNLPYSMEVVVDKDYDIYADSMLTQIMEGFKSYTYEKQNLAMRTFERINPTQLNKNQLFIIGRNILQSAIGGAFDCQNFINDQRRIERYSIDGNNHLFNGIFFEMYFDKESHLRETVKSNSCLAKILEYHSNLSLQCSFNYINRILLPFENSFLIIPSVQMNSVSLDVKLEKTKYKSCFDDAETDYYEIKSIRKDTVELLNKKNNDHILRWYGPRKFSGFNDLKLFLNECFYIPSKYIKIVSNVPQPDLELLLKI